MNIFFKFSTHLWTLCFFCITYNTIYSQPYTELNNDISWSPANYSTVVDIKAAFGNARIAENNQISSSITTTLTMPSQTEWDGMTNSTKALYLINAERQARGLLPFQAVNNNIITISQNFANYLLANNAFDHEANGSPGDRLNADPAINGCSEQGYTYGPECLAAYVQSSGAIPMPVERAVYGWIYEDSSSAWGHRNTCFAFFNNDFGLSSNEGFIGVGLATGGPWSGFGDSWENAAIVVFDFVDPCSSSTLTEAPVPLALNLKVFLQGPYDTGSMTTALNSGGFLKTSALTQPYNSAVWNYNGGESVSTDPNFFVNHPNIVDWVLIKLRTSTDAASTQSTRAAFIRSNGSIVDLDGISLVKFDGVSPDSYYIVVIHRNHLAVMSNDPVSLPNTSAYDFTMSQTQAYGTNSMKDLGSGVYGMAGLGMQMGMGRYKEQ